MFPFGYKVWLLHQEKKNTPMQKRNGREGVGKSRVRRECIRKLCERDETETKMKTKNQISTSHKDTIKGETLSNIRRRNDGSKIQRKVASSSPGPNLFSG